MSELPMMKAKDGADDPVCGMSVDTERAARNGLMVEHNGTTYFFCGRGCILDFRDDPEKYLQAGYQPSM